MKRFLHSLACGLLITGSDIAQVEPGQILSARVGGVMNGDSFEVRRSIGGKVTI